jgi:hydroxymethylpyrimidine pyrophosphatase-like HAD family hydrolase
MISSNMNTLQMRYVLIDIEGCLTIRKGKSITPEILMQFIRFQSMQKLIPIALCTGRPQPYVEATLQTLGLVGEGVILAFSIVTMLSYNNPPQTQ